MISRPRWGGRSRIGAGRQGCRGEPNNPVSNTPLECFPDQIWSMYRYHRTYVLIFPYYVSFSWRGRLLSLIKDRACSINQRREFRSSRITVFVASRRKNLTKTARPFPYEKIHRLLINHKLYIYIHTHDEGFFAAIVAMTDFVMGTSFLRVPHPTLMRICGNVRRAWHVYAKESGHGSA